MNRIKYLVGRNLSRFWLYPSLLLVMSKCRQHAENMGFFPHSVGCVCLYKAQCPL